MLLVHGAPQPPSRGQDLGKGMGPEAAILQCSTLLLFSPSPGILINEEFNEPSLKSGAVLLGMMGV